MSKQSKTEQPSAKEALRLNWRAAKIWWELMPKALIYKAWGAFFEASAPICPSGSPPSSWGRWPGRGAWTG